MTPQQYLRILIKRWWLILLVGVLGTVAAYFYLSRQPLRYRSEATLLLSPGLTKAVISADAPSRATYQLAQTYASYLRTNTFARLVVEREQLPITADEFSRAIDTRIREGTLFFIIGATGTTPEQAQLLAQAAANYFIQEIISQQQEQQRVRQAAARQGDTSMEAILREKMERERAYYEEQITILRTRLDQMSNELATIAQDEQRAALQLQLSEMEDKLIRVMSDQVKLLEYERPDTEAVDTASIVENATLPLEPIDENRLAMFLAAALTALMAGFALAVGLEYLDFTVRSPEEIEALYGEPVLAVLTNLPKSDNQHQPIVLTSPHAAVAEAFRVLRTNVQFSSLGKPLRSLVVTSAGPAEGKTTTALNLAIVTAQTGKRVILVDTDLRRPTIHKRLDLPNKVGFTTLVIADHPTTPATIQQHLQPGPTENLHILTSGPIPPNPSELLSAPLAHEVLTALEATADLVIYDSPPVATVTDAAVLASRADGVLQVVSAGHTRRDLITKARDILRRVDAHVLGPVLNRVEQHNIGYYYYYYYSNYYHTNGHHPPNGTPPKLPPKDKSAMDRFLGR